VSHVRPAAPAHRRWSPLAGLALLATVGTLGGCSSDRAAPAATTATTTVAAAGTTAAASSTGSDSTIAGPSLPAGVTGSNQQKVGELLVLQAIQAGVELDLDCVGKLTAQLSDADAAAIVSAYPNDPTGVSADGMALAGKLPACAASAAGATTTSAG
jgi:hypothetical protein